MAAAYHDRALARALRQVAVARQADFGARPRHADDDVAARLGRRAARRLSGDPPISGSSVDRRVAAPIGSKRPPDSSAIC
jgi:hypothetical protein